jgi:hypothetical protein
MSKSPRGSRREFCNFFDKPNDGFATALPQKLHEEPISQQEMRFVAAKP